MSTSITDSHRLGRFYYSQAMLSHPETLQQIFAVVIPVSVTYQYDRDCFEVVGLSDLFDLVRRGFKAPDYTFTFVHDSITATRNPA